MKIYLASSWRNPYQPETVEILRVAGHEVYDFRNPPHGTGFAWSEIDVWWETWTNPQYIKALDHPRSIEGYASDFGAMNWADVGVLLLPCGNSAHIELGWLIGNGKPGFLVLDPEQTKPDLMYKMATICLDIPDLLIKLD